MKIRAAILLTVGISLSTQVHAEGILDSLKDFFGFGDPQTEMVEQPTVDGLLSALTDNLNVSSEQAKGGLASLLNYAKNNVNPDTFAQLEQQIPGVSSVMGNLPDISDMQQEGLGGLLDMAAQYSESLQAVNDLKKQFEAIGLEPQMIVSYVEQAQAYLDTEEGQQAKQVLMEAFSSLTL
ncbi:DUF2780 domain-containing protein [Alteromonas sp. KUL49]|uniref:DUF2780 domain-containing protein n=1 Tax=Alteromonas sp. KUL49 TaxID=2480798 RepID=UPI00102F0967|nr:DUF2780 domain-containing protein [Alteromonas sp. KUL49]TAP41509.1 DUF2780 domain-containing protein [Alteromonas sp. KUL49]GEA10601.1 hypothetical protein KUL49_09760 [Alteromonas sp. KUL49]